MLGWKLDIRLRANMTLPTLPPQRSGTPWPTDEWAAGKLEAEPKTFSALVSRAFGATRDPQLGETHAFVAIHRGRLVAEHYAPEFGPDVTCPSWSKAKSITQALVGILVGDGKIDIHAPAAVPEWQDANDPRRAITLDLLLRMSSGLQFVEEYLIEKPSDVIEMLFGKGKGDVAHFAASFPPAHAPGSFWSYSSGTSNIVARAASIAAGARGAEFEAFMRGRLFEPLGMKSAIPKFDDAGTFIGSSFCFATPRDFARFGLLYLRDGIWEGKRLLPEGWVNYARTPTWQQPTEQGPYGAHFWLDIAGPGSFSANGYQGQFTVMVPERDLVLVRHGATDASLMQNVKDWVRAVAECFPIGAN
jgi:CubicO group peptidase (beta-lactamase class C family)